MFAPGAHQAYAGLQAEGVGPTAARARVVAGVAQAVARATEADLSGLALLSRWGPPAQVDLEGHHATPGLLGAVDESLLDPVRRRAGGVFYTPAALAAAMVGWALHGIEVDQPVVCDPAVGGGAVLLAAADALAARGLSPARVVGECLIGADIDPVAAAVSEAALALWCGGSAAPRVVVGDALAFDEEHWPARPHAVVGNPPFLNQLGRATARSPTEAGELRRRFGAAARGYVDTAVVFLVAATRLVRPGGTVALVLPQSFLATRDARSARSAVLADVSLEGLWLSTTPVFGAAVRVCVPVLRRSGARRATVPVWRGLPPAAGHDVVVDSDELQVAPTWSHLTVSATDVPECRPVIAGSVGEWAQVCADFRQEYYGVAPFVLDDPESSLDDAAFPRLVTSGLVDPAACRWGSRSTRHHRRHWRAPRVDLARLEAHTGLGPWARARLVPKIVVATQTRVLEAAVDRDGTWLPSTPLVSVVAPVERLWHLAAVLLSPVVTAWARRGWGGAALAIDAIKLGATQVRAVPVPHAGTDWDAAAEAVRRASTSEEEPDRRRWLLEAAAASCRAYRVEPTVLCRWWATRLPGALAPRPRRQVPASTATTGANEVSAGSGTVT